MVTPNRAPPLATSVLKCYLPADPLHLAKAYDEYNLSVHALEQREAPGFGQVLAERTLAVVKADQCPFGPEDFQVSCHSVYSYSFGIALAIAHAGGEKLARSTCRVLCVMCMCFRPDRWPLGSARSSGQDL